MIGILLKQALQSLLGSPIRSFLTILGVIIGISSVVMFMALGEGLRRDIQKEISGLGSNLLTVVPGQFGQGGGFSPNLISGDILKYEDIDKIQTVDGIIYISPMMLPGGILRHNDSAAPSAILMGTNEQFLDIFTTITIQTGRFFTAEENNSKARVIVLGSKIAQEFFGDTDPIGQTVTLGKDNLTVIGVTRAPEGTSIFGGSDYGAMSIMPIETAGELTGGIKITRILTKVDDNLDVRDLIPPVTEVLLTDHAESDFSVLTQEDLLGLLDTVLNLLTSAIAAIAAISLVVAGVGIMNIMLVAVTERTREIGLRKAVGATNGAILIQFLLEAIALTLSGALIALALNTVLAAIIRQVTPLHPAITIQSIVLAVSVAIVVGIIFGLAPALRAARLDPIKALRSE